MSNAVPSFHLSRSSAGPRLAKSALVFGVLFVAAGLAFAGECPSDKRVPDGQGQKPGPTAPIGVTDVVRSTTDLSKEPAAIQGRQFRLRQLDIAPGGVVPWHSHDNRPAMIYIVSGEIYEYSSSCSVPILHKTGDVAPEKKGTSHWWKNDGTTPVRLISVDLLPSAAQMDSHMM